MSQSAPPPQEPAAAPASKPRRKIPLRRKLLYLSIPFILFFGSLFGVEAFVRIAKPHVSSLAAFVEHKDPNRLHDNDDAPVFVGDPWTIWRFKPNLTDQHWDWTTFSTNNMGFRGTERIGKKPAGAIRILCLGDSVTFGFRVPMTRKDRPMEFDRSDLPYPAVIEQLLREANPGREIEVINMGTPGHTSGQGLALLRRDIAWLQPDIVTACFGWNDVSFRNEPDAKSFPGDFAHLLHRRLLNRSQAMIYLTRWMRERREAEAKAKSAAAPTPAPSPTERVPEADYISNHLEIAKLARAHGASTLFVSAVFRDRVANSLIAERISKHRAALSAAAEREGIPCLMMTELTEEGYSINDALFGEEIHPIALGMRLMGNEIVAALDKNGFLAKPGLKAH